MEWLYDLDSKTRHNVVSLLSQSIEHHQDFNKDVIKDMKEKFGLTTEQITNLCESLYAEKVNKNYGPEKSCIPVIELDVFSNGITIIDLQGDWVNSFSVYFTVTDRLYISIINTNVFEIEETEDEFIFNQWVLKKKSNTLTWKKEEQEMFWYRTFPSTKYKIKDQNKNDCSCSIL